MADLELEETITNHREALALLPPGHPDRSSSLNYLADAAYALYNQSGNIEDLEEMITYFSEVLTLHPTGHPDRSMSLNNLAFAIHTRYDHSGTMDDLEKVITYHCEALDLRSPGHPDRFMSLNNLGGAILTRYNQSGGMEDLEQVIKYFREALTLCPPAHRNYAMSLNNLANAVLTRYEQSGMTEDLEEVITYHRKALALCPPGHPDRSMSLNNLATAIHTSYDRSGSMEDLKEVIAYLREALSLFPSGHPDRSMCLDNLANAVLAWYKQFSRMEDLEEVIVYHDEALSLRPLGHPDRSMSLNSLATALHSRYEQSGSMEDLKQVILYHREALALCPPGHPDRSVSLDDLATAVHTRYEQSGSMEDLEEAITNHREALALRPPGHPDRSSSLNNLATVVHTRYEQLGRLEDLEEAITNHREAATLRPLGHPKHSSSLNNLASVVHARYDQSGRMEDLEEAIAYLRKALDLHSPGHPNRFYSLNNLATAVHVRYEQSGGPEDLEEVMKYHQEVLTLCPPGHPHRSYSLNNLASAFHTRYELSARMEDLKEGITYHREALTLCPPGHPNRSMSLSNLARAIFTCYKQSRRMQDFEESFTLYEQAVNDLVASSRYRLTIAICWAEQAREHHHNSVIRAYSMSLHLLNRCLIFIPNVKAQQKFLAAAPASLASDAASAAIDAGELTTAIELLEQGRSMLWSKLKGYRYPLDQLREVDAQLANDFEALNVQLENFSLSPESHSTSSQDPMSQAHLEAAMSKYRILSEQRENMIRQIRKIEAFRYFLQAVPFSTLQTVAAEGPVILINISHYRSDAIIIHIDKLPTLVALPKVQLKHLAYLDKQLALALHPDTPRAKCSTLIRPILCDLWNDVVSPVCDCLTQLAIPQESRIWWCPTSLLCALPLHAAGLYKTNKTNSNLPDIYTSSYTPTLSALISARSNIVIGQSVVPKLLVIGQPDTLKSVPDEINGIQQLGDFVDVMVGADASHDTVLHGLQQHSWAHFACHGYLGDDSQPFYASFELYDDSHLTLLDLIQARLPNAEFAFLASCHSAAGDAKTPDETIHLAAALQFCGFRSVVGTLWEMADKAGPIVSKAFYNYMFRNPGNKADIRDSAKGLNLAIRELRNQRAPLDCWIVFVHIGA